MRVLYTYPQRAFPYPDLVKTNRQRSWEQPEYELLDTGVFDGERSGSAILRAGGRGQP